MTKLWLAALSALGVGALIAACDNFYFLRGTLDGDCDPPRLTMTDLGSDSATLRRSNCQPENAVCCRTSVNAMRTSCQYPEDCYVAPFGGRCATPVDCSDTQTCTGGTCQCTLGGPPCLDPTTHLTTCCAAGQVCDPVMAVCSDNMSVTPVPDAGSGTDASP